MNIFDQQHADKHDTLKVCAADMKLQPKKPVSDLTLQLLPYCNVKLKPMPRIVQWTLQKP